MKVLHDKGIFSIEGVQIINPDVIVDRNPDNGLFIRKYQSMHLMDGDSFELPSNIIAEIACNYDCCNSDGRRTARKC